MPTLTKRRKCAYLPSPAEIAAATKKIRHRREAMEQQAEANRENAYRESLNKQRKQRRKRAMTKEDICNVEFVGVIDDIVGGLQMLNEAGNDFYESVEDDAPRITFTDEGWDAIEDEDNRLKIVGGKEVK